MHERTNIRASPKPGARPAALQAGCITRTRNLLHKTRTESTHQCLLLAAAVAVAAAAAGYMPPMPAPYTSYLSTPRLAAMPELDLPPRPRPSVALCPPAPPCPHLHVSPPESGWVILSVGHHHRGECAVGHSGGGGSGSGGVRVECCGAHVVSCRQPARQATGRQRRTPV